MNYDLHVGVIVLVVHQNKLLLGKRLNSYHSGDYGAPGGRLELHESLLECATRELFEETGLTLPKFTYLGAIRDGQSGYDFVHFAFLCTSYTGDPKLMEPDKCAGWEWFSPSEVPANLLRGHRAAVNLWLGNLTNPVDLPDQE